MAGSIVTRIPQLDVQFAAGSSYDPVKLQRMVQALNTVISQVTSQNTQIAAIAAEENAGVGQHVFATETGLGPEHTVSGLVPGSVVIATSETTAEFAQLQFAQLAGVDPNTFGNPAQGDVITFVNGYWSAEPSNPLQLVNPGQNALVMWTSTDGGAAGNYAWAVPDASLILTPGGLSVNQAAIVHANLAGLEFEVGDPAVIANDHPQYAMLAAANTWTQQQTFDLGLVSESDIDVYGNLEQAQAEPEWRIQNTDDIVNEGIWRIHAEPGQLIFSTVSDDGSDGENWLSVTRIAEIADAVNFSSNSLTWNGAQVLTSDYVPPTQSNPAFISGITAPGQLALTGPDPAIGYGAFGPGIVLQAVGDTANEGGWHLHVESGQLIWSTLDDSGSWGENWLSVTRNAELVDAINLQGQSLTFNGDPVWTDTYVAPGTGIYFTTDATGRRVLNAAAGGSLTLTDGTHTVSGVISLTVSGATVGGSTPNATLTVSGGGGSANITPDTHPGTELSVNDEFEFGSSVDTSGARFSGASGWTAFNTTGYTNSVVDGSIVLTNNSASSSLAGGYTQPLSGSTWAYAVKFSLSGVTGAGGGLFLATASAAAGKISCFLLTSTQFVVQHNTNATTFSANAFTGSTPWVQTSSGWVYLQIAFDGTNITYQVSETGVPGTFKTLFTETPAAFIGTPTLIGFTQGNPVAGSSVLDWFRKTL